MKRKELTPEWLVDTLTKGIFLRVRIGARRFRNLKVLAIPRFFEYEIQFSTALGNDLLALRINGIDPIFDVEDKPTSSFTISPLVVDGEDSPINREFWTWWVQLVEGDNFVARDARVVLRLGADQKLDVPVSNCRILNILHGVRAEMGVEIEDLRKRSTLSSEVLDALGETRTEEQREQLLMLLPEMYIRLSALLKQQAYARDRTVGVEEG